MLQMLSPALRQEVTHAVCDQMFGGIEFLVWMRTCPESLRVLMDRSTFPIFAPGDIIIESGQTVLNVHILTGGAAMVIAGRAIVHQDLGPDSPVGTFLRETCGAGVSKKLLDGLAERVRHQHLRGQFRAEERRTSWTEESPTFGFGKRKPKGRSAERTLPSPTPSPTRRSLPSLPNLSIRTGSKAPPPEEVVFHGRHDRRPSNVSLNSGQSANSTGSQVSFAAGTDHNAFICTAVTSFGESLLWSPQAYHESRYTAVCATYVELLSFTAEDVRAAVDVDPAVANKFRTWRKSRAKSQLDWLLRNMASERLHKYQNPSPASSPRTSPSGTPGLGLSEPPDRLSEPPDRPQELESPLPTHDRLDRNPWRSISDAERVHHAPEAVAHNSLRDRDQGEMLQRRRDVLDV